MAHTPSRTGVTVRLAEFVSQARPADLPEAVRREARRSFVNFLGCTIGGSRHEVVAIADAALMAFSGPPEATLVGRGRKADVLLASLINCLSSSVLTFDDTHAEAIVHPSGPVAAAVLALAERTAISGADFLLAFALGVETVCRLSKAISVAPARGTVAWNQTGIAGGIGAAVAAGKLLGLDARQLAWAIGIAASQAAGLRVVHGSMCMSMMPAQAAQTGLRAALLASHGFASSQDAIEGVYGHADTFSVEAHLPWLTDGLGETFEILSNTYKPFPCGIVIHASIEAALRLRKERAIDHRAVQRVQVRVNPKALQLTDRRHPKDSLEAQVSLYHWIAVSLVHGAARIAEGTESRIREPAVVSLRDRIEALPDPSVPPDSAQLSLFLEDGTIASRTVEHCIGSVARPMTDAELGEKFRDLAQGIIPAAQTERLLESCWSVDALPDAGAIARAAA